MTKKEMIEALDGLDDDAKIKVEVKVCIFDSYRTEELSGLKVTHVYESEQLVVLHGEL